MANYYKISGYKVAGYKIAHIDMASRAEVEDWITNLAEPTLTYSTSGNNVIFNLTFTPAPAAIAAAVEQHKGIQFQIVRHSAAGGKNRCRHGASTTYKTQVQRDRGMNYNNWIQYFPTNYKNQLTAYTCDSGHHVLTLPSLSKTTVNITAAELQSGSITRTFRKLSSLWTPAYAKGGGGHSYEFFIGLMYWDHDRNNLGNKLPYKFKMGFYRE